MKNQENVSGHLVVPEQMANVELVMVLTGVAFAPLNNWRVFILNFTHSKVDAKGFLFQLGKPLFESTYVGFTNILRLNRKQLSQALAINVQSFTLLSQKKRRQNFELIHALSQTQKYLSDGSQTRKLNNFLSSQQLISHFKGNKAILLQIFTLSNFALGNFLLDLDLLELLFVVIK